MICVCTQAEGCCDLTAEEEAAMGQGNLLLKKLCKQSV